MESVLSSHSAFYQASCFSRPISPFSSLSSSSFCCCVWFFPRGLLLFVCLLWFFGGGGGGGGEFHNAAQVDLELKILLPLPPKS